MNIAQKIREAAAEARAEEEGRCAKLAALGEQIGAARARLAAELAAAGAPDADDVRAEVAVKLGGVIESWAPATGARALAQHDVAFRLRGRELLSIRWRPEELGKPEGWAPTRATHLRFASAELALEAHFEDREAARAVATLADVRP